MTTHHNRSGNLLGLFLLLLPVVCFFFYVSTYALNVPYMDDMELIYTVNDLEASPSRWFSVLVRQMNDHRTLFSRLGILLTYAMGGTIDFRTTILVGYLNLMLLGFSFFLLFKSFHKPLILFLPVTLLLFSPIVYQDHLWSMTAYQYTLSIAFSLLALYFLHPQCRKYWLLSVPFSVAATLTNLDGISILPVVLLWLVTQRRGKDAVYYAAFSVCYLLIYFADFRFSFATKIPLTPEALYPWLLSFLALTGSIAKLISDTHSVVLSIVAGCFIIITFLGIKYLLPVRAKPDARRTKGSWLQFDLVEISFGKLIASMAMISLGRFADGPGVMMSIRFQIYAVSLLIVFYLFLLKHSSEERRPYLGYAAIGVAFMGSLYTYIKYDSAVNYLASGLMADTYNYTHDRLYLHQYFTLPDPDPGFYAHYRFPTYFEDSLVEAWKASPRPNAGTSSRLTVSRIENTGVYQIHLNPLLEFHVQTQQGPAANRYLCLIPHGSQAKSYLVALRKAETFWARLRKNADASVEWYGSLPKKLPSDTYTVLLCWVDHNQPESVLLSQSISL